MLAIICLAACHPAPPPATPPSARLAAPAPSVKLDTLAGSLDGAWGRGHQVWIVGSVFAPGGSAEMPSHGVILQSSDDAFTWREVRRERPALQAIWGSGNVVIAVGSGVVRSLDGGATWRAIDVEHVKPPGTRLYAVTGHGRDVWAAGCTLSGFMSPGYVMHSRDAGATWRVALRDVDGCPSGPMWTNGRAVYATGSFVTEEATHALVVASPNGGATWRRTVLDGARRVEAIGGNGNDVYVRTSTAPALVSRDGGAHFIPVPSPPVPLLDKRGWQDGTSVYTLDVERSTVVRKP